MHPNLETIYFNYLESRNSFLHNDTDFVQVESSLKLQVRIYTMDEFKSIIPHHITNFWGKYQDFQNYEKSGWILFSIFVFQNKFLKIFLLEHWGYRVEM